jgi:hypothetical protein
MQDITKNKAALKNEVSLKLIYCQMIIHLKIIGMTFCSEFEWKFLLFGI